MVQGLLIFAQVAVDLCCAVCTAHCSVGCSKHNHHAELDVAVEPGMVAAPVHSERYVGVMRGIEFGYFSDAGPPCW